MRKKRPRESDVPCQGVAKKIKFWVISCSMDREESPFAWSGEDLVGYKREALADLEDCRARVQCDKCDAQIHKVIVERKS
jgi:hypothetical protein